MAISVTSEKPRSELSAAVKMEITTVTPKMATKWLAEDADNPKRNNRGISGTTISAYARDMAAGRWQLSEAAICFDVDGILINGQHRLHACCLADKSFDVIVMRGLPRKAQETMDQQRPRRVGDVLALRGHVCTVALAGAARRLSDFRDISALTKGMRITVPEVVALIERHPKLVDSVRFCLGDGDQRVRGIPTSLAIALHYTGKVLLKQPQKADAFIRVFQSGIPNYSGDPAHKLREKMLSRSKIHHVMKSRDQIHCGIRAWNAFSGGEKMMKFQVPRQPVSVYKLDPDLI